MAAFTASVDEARSFKVANKLSYFRRHQVTLCGSIAQRVSSADGLRSMEKEFNFYGLVWELNVAGLGAV